jgi:hypothetical protein
MMQSSKKNGVEVAPLRHGPAWPAHKKEPLSPLSEQMKPLLACPDRRQRCPSRYTLCDIQKAIDLAG